MFVNYPIPRSVKMYNFNTKSDIINASATDYDY